MGILALPSSAILDSTAAGRSILTAANASAQRSLLGLGSLATQSANIADYLTIAGAAAAYQPLDSDLTAIAALSTTSFGRGLLTQADAPTARSTLGLGSIDSPTFLRGTFTGGTVSGASAPVLNLTQTWNDAAVTFTGLDFNVTDTASNAASLLLNLRVGGTSFFSVNKAGVISCADRIAFNGGVSSSPRLRRIGNSLDVVTNDETAFATFRAGELWLGSSAAIVLDASDILAQRRSTSAQAFRIYNTFTNTSNYERAKIAWESNILRIGTENLGTGSARALEIQTAGVTRMTFAGNGSVTVNTGLAIQSNAIVLIGNVSVAGAATQFVYDAASGSSYTGTSGATTQYAARSGFAPTSGTMTFTGFSFTSTINQTGGANGITRGIFINPTLTAAADFRAIEVALGKTILAAATTGAATLNIPSGTAPSSPVNGDIWFDGTNLNIRIGGVTRTVNVT